MTKEKYVPIATAVALAASMLIALPVFAQTGGGAAQGQFRGGMRGGMPPGVFGDVTAVNGDTLSVTAMLRPFKSAPGAPSGATSTVFTVDATNATVYKGSATTTVPVSSIAIGDKVMVQGTVSGTDVAATVIRDGVMGPAAGGPGMWGGKGGPGHPTSTPPVSPIQGNGEPVVGGSIAQINGDTLTVTNASNVTYTIDVTNATIVKNGTTTAATDLAIGDNVVVQGTVNGTSITASSILDQGAKPSNGSSTGSSTVKGGFGGGFGGFFGMIGGFFAHLFGF
ncbi:MAG TPA: DUF5666 domain-containing protein [Candidatus Paceibacterota bacterium]|nr:DUF5666 domain-containing protein [Candidatus Paceibacterota bacterium]